MPILMLRRDRALSEDEKALLPKGSVPIDDGTGLVARAELDGPLAKMLALAAAMARAIPDADFLVKVPEASAELPAVPGAVAPSRAPEPSSDEEPPTDPEDEAALAEKDPWELLDKGDVEAADKRFALGYALDGAGRDRVRLMVLNGEDGDVARGLRIARVTGWKSFVSNARRLTQHDNPEVRAEAARVLGSMGGYSQLTILSKMLEDKVQAVRDAAKEGIDEIEGRKR